MKEAYRALEKATAEARKRQQGVDQDREGLLKAVAKDILKVLQPLLGLIAEKSKVNADEIRKAVSEATIKVKVESETPQVNVNVPDIIVPDIRVPAPQVNYTPPAIHIPDIVMPKEMDIRGWVQLQGVDLGHPLPVQLRDANGRPVNLLENLTTVIGGGGGGKSDYFTIKGFSNSAFAEFMNPDGRVKVEMPAGAAGLTDLELRASSVPVEQVSGSIWSVYVTGMLNSTTADVINPDNRIRVALEPGGGGLTDTELRASSVPVEQVSGSNWSVFATNPFGPGEEATALRITQAGDCISSVYVRGFSASVGATILNGEGLARDSWQVSGIVATIAANIVDSGGIPYTTTNPVPIDDAGGAITVDGSVAVTGITGSIAASLIDSSGVGYSGSNPLPIVGPVVVTSITNTTAANIVDSTGIAYEGANPFPISGNVNVNGSLNSVLVTGPTVADAIDDGSAPIQMGGIARQANPTAVAANDVVKATFDDLGRQLVRPVQIRDLIATAYVSKVSGSTFGTETTLLASGAGVLLDLIYVMGTNDSTAAIQVDLRASTGGTVCKSIEIPAGGTAGVSLPVPYPAPFADHTWTIDLPDVTGTNITISALFSKEV